MLKHNFKLYIALALVVLSLFVIWYIGAPDNSDESGETDAQNSIDLNIGAEESKPLNYYVARGTVPDSLLLYEGTIKLHQNLSEILLGFNVSYSDIDHLAKKSKAVFNVMKFATGKNYKVFYTNDSLQKVHTFIYEIDAVNYVVFNLKDSISISMERKEVEIRIRTASGVITSSLWQTAIDNNINADVPMLLSEIYAWAIDFYRIHEGDYFKVIYEEKYVEDEPIGAERVLAAKFNHSNEDFYAIYFEQGDAVDYFDENAKSLRRAFLKAPLKFSRISSKFSMKRFHPVQKIYKPHLGTDYAAPRGTPIMTTGDGVVDQAGYSLGNGNYVKVKHNSVYTTQYLHMNKIKPGIRKGARVRQGDNIGWVGSTGLATGPHVCYRFWKNGVQVDALKVKLPASMPVDKNFLGAYNKVKEEMMWKLKENIEEATVSPLSAQKH